MESSRFLLGGVSLVLSALVANSGSAQTNRRPRILTGEIAFSRQVIDNALNQNFLVAAADFDRDGFMDAVSADYVNGVVYWYRNDHSGGFQRRIVDPSIAGSYPVDVADVDRDGDMDVLVGAYIADLFLWYENDGSGGFTRRVVGSSNGPHSIIAVDLDRDGDNDFVTSSQDGDNIAWYENNGSQTFTPHIVTNITDGAKRADYADLDRDGDWDILSAAFFSATVLWHENDGHQNFTTHVIDATVNGAYFVDTADLDSDGDQDVMAASQINGEIPWYVNDGAGGFTKRVIDPSAPGARAVWSADVDGDGDLDPVGASVSDDTAAWHENDGRGNFTQRTIDRLTNGCYGVYPVDMDGDGDIDVLTSSRDTPEVALHTQMKRHSLLVDFGGVRVIGNTILRTTDPDHLPSQLIYTLTDAPDAGQLRWNGTPLLGGATFTQADIDQQRLTYVHGGVSRAADRFAFAVRDSGPNSAPPAGGEFEIVVRGAGWAELFLDEGSGTIALDASGNNHHGALLGAPTYDTSTRDGSPYSLRLDGVDDVIDLGRLDVNGTGLTLAGWFNLDQYTGFYRNARLVSKTSSQGLNDHVFSLGTIRVDETATHLEGLVRVGGIAARLVAAAGNIAVGTWYHAALTHDGVTLRLYLDGIEVGRMDLAGRVDQAPGISVAAGAQPPSSGAGQYLDGLLDDVRILDRAMARHEIARLASGCAGAFTSYGAGLAGTGGFVPLLIGVGCPELGATVAVGVTRGLGGAPGVILLSFARTAIPVLGGTLLVEPWVSFGLALSGSGPGNGVSALPVLIPFQFELIGSAAVWQALFFDPSAPQGISFTAGLDLSIGR